VEALWAEVIKKQIRFWLRTHPRDAGIEFISPTLNRYFCLVAAGFHEATSLTRSSEPNSPLPVSLN
jgi:hypothetical protein